MNFRIARVLGLAAVAIGATMATAPAQATPCPLSPYPPTPLPQSTVFVDCGYHTGVGTGTLGATSAQRVCLGSCMYIDRSGAYYNWHTGSLCVKVATTTWIPIGGTGC